MLNFFNRAINKKKVEGSKGEIIKVNGGTFIKIIRDITHYDKAKFSEPHQMIEVYDADYIITQRVLKVDENNYVDMRYKDGKPYDGDYVFVGNNVGDHKEYHYKNGHPVGHWQDGYGFYMDYNEDGIPEGECYKQIASQTDYAKDIDYCYNEYIEGSYHDGKFTGVHCKIHSEIYDGYESCDTEIKDVEALYYNDDVLVGYDEKREGSNVFIEVRGDTCSEYKCNRKGVKSDFIKSYKGCLGKHADRGRFSSSILLSHLNKKAGGKVY